MAEVVTEQKGKDQLKRWKWVNMNRYCCWFLVKVRLFSLEFVLQSSCWTRLKFASHSPGSWWTFPFHLKSDSCLPEAPGRVDCNNRAV